MSMFRNDKSKTILPLIVGFLSVGLIVSAFARLRVDEPLAGLPEGKTAKVGRCEPKLDILAQAPASLRGSTAIETWHVFEDDFSFLPPPVRSVPAKHGPGARALRLTIKHKGNHPYDIGVSMENARPIQKGEKVEARIWLRLANADQGKRVSNVEVRLQSNGRGFEPILSRNVVLTPQFQEYVLTAVAPRDYCVGRFNVAVHLATDKHVVEVGQGEILVAANPA